MTTMRQDLMFLRNLVHGAPIPRSRAVVRLRQIDEHLNENIRDEKRRLPTKPDEYYAAVLDRIPAS